MKSLMFVVLIMVSVPVSVVHAESRFFNPQVEVGMFPHFFYSADYRPAENWAVLGEGISKSFVVSSRFRFYKGEDGMNYFITPRFVVDQFPIKADIYDFERDYIIQDVRITTTHFGYGGEIGFGYYVWGRLWTGASAGMDVTNSGGWNHYFYALTVKIRMISGLNLGVRTELGKKARVSMVFGL